MRTRPRTPPAALLAAVLLVVIAGCVGSVLGGPPEIAVENDADDAYRVVVYTAPADDPADLAFSRAANGSRRPTSAREVQFPTGERNVRLDDEGATLQRRLVVDPDEEATATLDGWAAGETTVYLVETLDRRLVYARIVDCGRRGQTRSLTVVSNESFEASSTCG